MAWSEQLVYEMQGAITRAADALGAMAPAQDDLTLPCGATRQGLLAMPEQLSLFDWEMRVAAHRHDLDGLKPGLPCPPPGRAGPGPAG